MKSSKIFAEFFKQDEYLQKYAELLIEALEQGNVCLHQIEDSAKQGLLHSGFTGTSIKDVKPFILFNNNLYLQRYFKYECKIIEKLNEIVSNAPQDLILNKIDFLVKNKDIVAGLFDFNSNNKSINYQLIAALGAFLNRFYIITGGPGTGKTTTITRMLFLQLLFNPELKIVLAAPTGKAVSRMKESIASQLSALPQDKKILELLYALPNQTLHGLLGMRPYSTKAGANEENPIAYDLIIVDESSMIDAPMMSKLVAALPKDASIILLGDKNQLASVEAGSVFGDLCNLHANINTYSKTFEERIKDFIPKDIPLDSQSTNKLSDTITELVISRRFSDDSELGKMSKAILLGQTEVVLQQYGIVNSKANEGVELRSPKDLLEHTESYLTPFEAYCAAKLSAAERMALFQNIKILCAVKEGPMGTMHWNKQSEEYLNKKGLISKNENNGWYHLCPIIITRNDAQTGLSNGDIGIILKNETNQRYEVYFNEDVILPFDLIKDFEKVYAMTIHKSQGSEFEQALIIMPEKERQINISRELIYTAITRAKKKAIVFSEKDMLETAIQYTIKRSSGIQLERFN